ncbi:MAG TPA: saccharopine dehydrogenase NADP-binding domain-containing protein, partial [Streptosporangiaceae bacterium]|nr:saccharopine dehydrogenase NADP-binding domain-containing protein [Streptosporangiaceae bacterium]
MSDDRELDVVVFGATGFAGRLVAGYLAANAPPGVRIGLAGRSRERLARVRDGLGGAASAWPLLIADSGDPPSLAALAGSARVVATTVGPYYRQGLPLVEACARAGTDYADLAGEVLFLRESIGRCHELAQSTGARIVHCCGFDSIPSDLGVLRLHQAARADDAGNLEDTTLVVTALRGGVSGGTLAAMTGQLDEVRASAEHRRAVADPYAISPDRAAEPRLGGERDRYRVRYQADLGIWTGPFVMAGINTRVVRRSNAVQDWAYGRRFRYREVTGFGRGPAAPVLAAAVSGGLVALAAGLAFRPSRALLGRLLPRPGEGPSDKTQQAGFFRMEIHTRTSAGARYRARVEARGDPGYAATSVMFGESALCLALDRDRLPARAGVLTPATAMGDVLAGRLIRAGHTFTAERITP